MVRRFIVGYIELGSYQGNDRSSHKQDWNKVLPSCDKAFKHDFRHEVGHFFRNDRRSGEGRVLCNAK
jgi:hypothetical protein